MFFHATRRKHKIRGDPFVRNKQGLTPLTLAAKLGRKEMFHEILEYQSMVRNHLIKEKRSCNKLHLNLEAVNWNSTIAFFFSINKVVEKLQFFNWSTDLLPFIVFNV